MASYVDPELYPREEEKLKICTSCGAIIHEMSIPVHDHFHEWIENFRNNQILVNEGFSTFLADWVKTSDSKDSADRDTPNRETKRN